MNFELRSSDEEILDIAHGVFSRWPAPGDSILQGAWEIRRTADGFVIDPQPVAPPGSTIPTRLVADQAVTVVEYSAIWRIIEQCTHILAFHSALLSRDGKTVAIVGPSEAGKSTLSTALWKHGWSFLCDDTTMVAEGRAAPAPRRVALRATSRALVGEDLWREIQSSQGYRRTIVGCLFHPGGDSGELEVDLTAVIFLKRNGAPTDAVGPTALTPADAALALLPYTNLVRTLPFPEALAPIAALMSVVPAWDLPRGSLPDMIAAVEQLTGVNRTASA